MEVITDRPASPREQMTEPMPEVSTSVRTNALLTVLLAVALIALVVFGVNRLMVIRSDSRAEDGRTAAILAARSEVVTLLSISPTTSKSDVAKLLDGATKDFKAQFNQQAAALQKAVKDAKVTSKGSIASSGVVSFKGNKAVVLVAASGTVKNTNTTKPEARNYRLKVTLDKIGSRWLVSGMDFVA